MPFYIRDLSGLSSVQLTLLVLGFVLWAIAYALIIRQGFLDKTYGIPWFSLCLNFSWEIFMAVYCPSQSRTLGGVYCPGSHGIWLPLLGLWCLLDAIIFTQFLIYGRHQKTVMGRFFYPIVIGFFGFSALAVPLFIFYFSDTDGQGLAWILNLVMSTLFIVLYFSRPDLKGLSLGAAWAKMLGSLFMVVTFPSLTRISALLYLLAFCIFVADSIYVFLLTSRCRAIGRQASRGEQGMNAAAA